MRNFDTLLKPLPHWTATTLRPWRPRESTRSPCGRRISEKRSAVWLGSCCACTALWRATFVSPVAFPLWSLRQRDAHTTTSRRPRHAPSATISDQNATVQRRYYDLGDRTTLLGRSHCVYCAHTASVPRSYGDHRRFAVYMAPFNS